MGKTIQKPASETRGEVFKVREYLAAGCLRAGGAEFVGVEIDAATGRGLFCFSDRNGQASGLFAQHRRGELSVNSRAVVDAVLSLKSELFSLKPVRS